MHTDKQADGIPKPIRTEGGPREERVIKHYTKPRVPVKDVIRYISKPYFVMIFPSIPRCLFLKVFLTFWNISHDAEYYLVGCDVWYTDT